MAEPSKGKPQPFEHLLVMDFEATGDVPDSKTWEIIEFPCVILNVNTLEIEDVFHRYVRPTRHKKLSPQCLEITKISQDTVNKATPLEQVLEEFYAWIESKKLQKVAVVTCGDWDLKTMLPSEVRLKNLKVPPDYMQCWINVKIPFSSHVLKSNRNRAGGMKNMLDKLGISLDGQHHSGIDDSKNIAKIVIQLLKTGCIFKITGRQRDYGRIGSNKK